MRFIAYVFCATLPLLLVNPGRAQSTTAAYIDLFDGETLTGWRGYKSDAVPAGWSVDEGQIKGSGEAPDLVTVETYTDFELQFEWKLAEGGNSGVLYRVSETGEQAYHTGPEYQLLDDDHFRKELAPVHSTAAIYGLYGSIEKTLNPAGEFNSAKIVVLGKHIEHWLNGELINKCEIDSDDWKIKLAASKFHEWPTFSQNMTGHIVLQAHGSEVWYRNLKLKRLQPPPSDPDTTDTSDTGAESSTDVESAVSNEGSARSSDATTTTATATPDAGE